MVDTTQYEGSYDPNDQWDVVRAIQELTELKRQIMRAVSGTTRSLGVQVGVDQRGDPIVEHPLGAAIGAVDMTLKACYAKYGQDLHQQALKIHTGEVTDEPS